MDNNEESILTSIDVFVDDENRIVTYKTLCKELALSTTQAKRYLQKYAENCKRNNESKVTVTYSVAGRNDKGLCVKITRQKDLEALKSKLKEVRSVSIYSVQKCDIKDASTLYSVDVDHASTLHQYSAIKYEGATRVETQQMVPNEGAKVDVPISKPKEKLKPKNNLFANVEKKPATVTKTDPFKTEKTKTNSEPKKSKAKPKQGGMAMFLTKEKTDPFASKPTKVAKVEPESPEQIAIDEPDLTESVKESKPEPKKKDSKKPPKPKKKEVVPDRDEDFVPLDDDLDDFCTKSKSTSKKGNPQNKDEESLKKSPTKESPEKPPEKKKSKKEEKRSKGKRKNSANNPVKKRRRIQAMSSSSESESEQEEQEPPSPPPSPPKPKKSSKHATPGTVHVTNDSKNHRRKKVLKKKTYIDGEGDMVTEKVYEYESCSSDPDDKENSDVIMADVNDASKSKPAKIEKPEKKVTQPAKKTKQQSIMGFFAKK